MNKIKLIFLTLGMITLGVGMFYSTQTPKESALSDKIQVTVSFYPLAYIVAQVGGEYVSVTNLLPPGGEPHDFEPSLQSLALLSKNDLFLYNGASFEPWVEKWKKSSFEFPTHVVDMINELGKRETPLIVRNDAIDPHVWLDPVLFKQQVEIVRDVLIQIDPAHTNEYTANAARLEEVIGNLDQGFRDGLSSCEKDSIITSHDAFGYLSQQYNFGIIPIAGISPDEEPSPKALAAIVDVARSKNVKYIFSETTESSKLSAVIAREIGGSTLVLNPLESLTQNEVQLGQDYLSIMLMNLNNLRTALVCN